MRRGYFTPPVLIILAIIIFAVAIIRSFFPPEKTKQILSKFPEAIGKHCSSNRISVRFALSFDSVN